MAGLILWASGCVRGAAGAESASATAAAPPPVVRSNILRADYAGSESCRACHRSLYQDWLGSPMRQMTRLPTTARIQTPFDGRAWKFKDDEARFELHAGTRFVQIRSRRFGNHLYRVTRVIGGRTREDFAGVEVTGTQPDAHIIGDAHDEVILPASYFFETASFRLKGYSVMVRERPGLKAGAVWNQSCVLCHNTAPTFLSLWGALLGKGAPAYQGELVDALLPEGRRWRLQVTDANAARAAVADEVHHLSGASDTPADLPAALRQGIAEMNQRFAAEHLLEIGIGCEACHGGCREHVRSRGFRLPTSRAARSSTCSLRRAAAPSPVPSRSTEPAHAATRFSSRAIPSPGRVVFATAARRAAVPPIRAKRGTCCWAGAAARWRAPTVTIPTATTIRTIWLRWPRWPATPPARNVIPPSPTAKPYVPTPTTIPMPRAACALTATCRARTWP